MGMQGHCEIADSRVWTLVGSTYFKKGGAHAVVDVGVEAYLFTVSPAQFSYLLPTFSNAPLGTASLEAPESDNRVASMGL